MVLKDSDVFLVDSNDLGRFCTVWNGFGSCYLNLPETHTDDGLFDYPVTVLKKLFMDPVRGEAHKENFFRVLRFGLCCTTTFSGFDAPREAMRLMVLALQSICPEKGAHLSFFSGGLRH